MMMFRFSIFNQKYPFWANLFQQFKIVSLGWNLVPRLIQICSIQWWCSLFCFSPGINTLLGKFGPKIKFVRLSWNLVSRLIWICRIQWRCSLFLLLTRNSCPKHPLYIFMLHLSAIYSDRLFNKLKILLIFDFSLLLKTFLKVELHN